MENYVVKKFEKSLKTIQSTETRQELTELLRHLQNFQKHNIKWIVK